MNSVSSLIPIRATIDRIAEATDEGDLRYRLGYAEGSLTTLWLERLIDDDTFHGLRARLQVTHHKAARVLGVPI